MICKNCEKNVPDSAAFCDGCGARMEIIRPQPVQQQPVQQQPVQQQPVQQQYGYQNQQQYGAYQNQNQQYGYQNQQYGYQNQNQYGYQQPQGYPNPNAGKVDFGTAIKLFFSNYANFSGRASKSEYWWTVLFTFLVGLIPYLGWVAAIAFFIPSLAVMVRRLHDTGKSGAYYFMCLIPIAGAIILIIQLCKDSEPDNVYGPAPR